MDDIIGLLLANFYNGESRGLMSELESCFSHDGHICKNDSTVVHMKIEEHARGKSVESKINPFSRRKNIRVSF